jgi:hypothetical protein
LKDPKTFESWVKVYDRVSSGEMPPESEDRPDANVQQKALTTIESSLTRQSRKLQAENGRASLRRLTRIEYEYAVQDLLGIHTQLAIFLPEENSAGFDTVAVNQGISQLHVQAWLNAANVAIESALNLGEQPLSEPERFEFLELKSIKEHFNPKGDDRVILGKADDGIIVFESGSTYLYSLKKSGMPHTGIYKIRVGAEAVNSEQPVILAVQAGNYKNGQTRILAYRDIEPDEPAEIEFETVVREGEYLFPQALDLVGQEDGKTVWSVTAEKYQGAGLKLKWLEIEGPMHEVWPPRSARDLLPDAKFKKREHQGWVNGRHVDFFIEPPKDLRGSIQNAVERLAGRAFRRPLKSGEVNEYVLIAEEALRKGVAYQDAARMALRAVLCSPEFLFFGGDPGKLDDYSLASRLSFFLWKSMPDEALLSVAAEGKLSDPKVLWKQVDRMLDDPRSMRFKNDFVNQWLGIEDIDATTPDQRLYPEYDPALRLAMLEESVSFFAELVDDDLSVSNLVDSDFVMINRRLAQHYGMDEVEGQTIQKVDSSDSVRGGLLTQAAILKISANGTNTSPVRRGNWVLTNLLGTPSAPPPPNVGSIEPDTRGTTTIREELAAHRADDVCNRCHRNIDPPGFALESFDVIGGFRERYRSKEHGERTDKKLLRRPIWQYKLNLPVDSSGKTPDGETFEDIVSYRKLLLKRKEQIARNLVQRLITYSTGCEIQFADRPAVESILQKIESSEYGVRSMIHEVVQSELFLSK